MRVELRTGRGASAYHRDLYLLRTGAQCGGSGTTGPGEMAWRQQPQRMVMLVTMMTSAGMLWHAVKQRRRGVLLLRNNGTQVGRVRRE